MNGDEVLVSRNSLSNKRAAAAVLTSSSDESNSICGGDENEIVSLPCKCDYTLGQAVDGVTIVGTIRLKRPLLAEPNNKNPPPCTIGIRGVWYDAAKFAAHHPGGDIIYEFHQKDSTAQFLAFHDPKILTQRIKLAVIGSYDFDKHAPGGSTLQGAWMKLNDKFEQEGRYTTPISFLWSRVGIIVAAYGSALVFFHLYLTTQSYVAFFAAAMCMASIWHQSGFLMHDTMHNHIFHDRKRDSKLGFVFGNVLLGVSGRWWRDEHNEHHVFTNTVVEGIGPSDPQMAEDVWIQDQSLIPFFAQNTIKFILEYQQYYFVPLLMVVGLLFVKVDAITHSGRFLVDILGLAIHIAWVGCTIWVLPTGMERFVFYVLANGASGCLGIQLLVSHHAKPWQEKEKTKQAGSWAHRQIEALIDITCPLWMDWFHGGLHIHSVHHLYPRMCRCHYRAVYDEILTMCKEHGSPIDRSGWLETIARCLTHLSTITNKANLPVGNDKSKDA